MQDVPGTGRKSALLTEKDISTIYHGKVQNGETKMAIYRVRGAPKRYQLHLIDLRQVDNFCRGLGKLWRQRNFRISYYVIPDLFQPQPQPHLQIGESVGVALERASSEPEYAVRIQLLTVVDRGPTEHDGVLNVHVHRQS
jgi:hypothetical protein